MKKMVLHGGRALKGTISASGSKNATLPIMAATLLSDEPSTITGVPMVRDIRTFSELIKILGANAYLERSRLDRQPDAMKGYRAP